MRAYVSKPCTTARRYKTVTRGVCCDSYVTEGRKTCMAEESSELEGPDFEKGVETETVADGEMLLGHAFGEPVLVVRRGDDLFGIGATCTHYGGPLAKGLMVDCTVRCPWHHARFDLRTGEAIAAPALNDVACYNIEKRGNRFFVTGKIDKKQARTPATAPASIVIVGAGAAGGAAAETLRREGYDGPVTMIGADEFLPYDRPNLSKDYLAGSAPEEWIPLRPPEFYREQRLELRLGMTATALDVAGRRVMLSDGEALGFDKLLLATGAEPIRLQVPGAELPHVRTLRSLADSRELIARTRKGSRAIVVGASFIGLEAAAALRHREVEVHVVAPEARPMERVLGPALGDFVRSLHEVHGVVFHLGRTLAAIGAGQVRLEDGALLDAEIVVVGIGVRPRLGLAEQAGLAIDRGVVVDEYLETSAPGIFAAGDIARWPDARSGQRIRVEHWVVAERQGQV